MPNCQAADHTMQIIPWLAENGKVDSREKLFLQFSNCTVSISFCCLEIADLGLATCVSCVSVIGSKAGK